MIIWYAHVYLTVTLIKCCFHQWKLHANNEWNMSCDSKERPNGPVQQQWTTADILKGVSDNWRPCSAHICSQLHHENTSKRYLKKTQLKSFSTSLFPWDMFFTYGPPCFKIFSRLPGWLNLHWNKFLAPTGGLLPCKENQILRLNRTHNDPLIGAHMFSQRASVTKLPGLVWSMKQVLEETYWQVLWSNQLSPCACSVDAHWRLEALLLGAHLCTETLWMRTDSMDQGNLQHCWVL